MRRTCIAALLSALLPGVTSAATVYRCHTAHGVSYQDLPCNGRDFARNVVDLGEPTVVKRSARDDALAEWADQAEQESQRRTLETRVRSLRQQNDAERAEFAAMIEENQQKQAAARQGTADLPSLPMLEIEAQRLQQEYAQRIQQSNAELRATEAELNAVR